MKNYSRFYYCILFLLRVSLYLVEDNTYAEKTFEKWITAYNKNNKIFDSDYISQKQQIQKLKKRIEELETANEI